MPVRQTTHQSDTKKRFSNMLKGFKGTSYDKQLAGTAKVEIFID